MLDKDFDQFFRNALENLPEPEYNPADWDMLEDRLHQLQTPQAQPAASSAGVAGSSLAKLGFVASTVLFTALNVANLVNPVIFKDANQNVSKTSAVVEDSRDSLLNEITNPTVSSENKAGEMIATQSLDAEVGNQGENGLVIESGLTAPATKQALSAKSLGVKNGTASTTSASGKNFNNWVSAVIGAGTQTGGSIIAKSVGNNAGITPGCVGNTKPELAWMLNNSDTLHTNQLLLSTCQTLNLRLLARDKEADKITITSNIASILPGARLVSGSNGETATIQWEAKPGMARLQPYTFIVWIADASCPTAEPRAYQYALHVAPAFTAAIKGPASIEPGHQAALEITGAPQGASFRWLGLNGTQNNVKSARLEVSPLQTTTYRVEVISPKGCIFTDSLKVEVVQPKENDAVFADLDIPNVITPNNDGLNDYFELKLPIDQPVRLEIFDRMGKQVYAREQYDNSWNGAGLAAGVYFYVLQVQNHKTYKGWVEVLR